MSFAVTVMQTLSAFVIFVAGFVVLLVAIICAVVLASGIYHVVRLAKSLRGENSISIPGGEPSHEGTGL
jgi:hypothetical protein